MLEGKMETGAAVGAEAAVGAGAAVGDLIADAVVADVLRALSETVARGAEVAAVVESLVLSLDAPASGSMAPRVVNRFMVGGVPVEVRAPAQAKRHTLVRNSTAHIDHVKQLNTPWALSGPPSVTTTDTLRRPRSGKKSAIKSRSKADTAPDTSTADAGETPAPKPVPSAYTRHITKQKRQRRVEKLVQSQRRNGSKGLEHLWDNIRRHNIRLGVKHMERPLLRTLCQRFDDTSSNHATLLGGALALEALVKDPKMHIELRSRLVLEAAARIAQKTDLLRGDNAGAGWRIMRALVSAVGRLTEDTASGRPNKHNRMFCINQGALVILVHAMASDMWQKMESQAARETTVAQRAPTDRIIPQWGASAQLKLRPTSTGDKETALGSSSKSASGEKQGVAQHEEDTPQSREHEMPRSPSPSIGRKRPSTVPPKMTRSRRSRHAPKSSVPRTPPTKSSTPTPKKTRMRRPSTRSTQRRRKANNNNDNNNKAPTASRDKVLKALKRQTQHDAVRLLQAWAADTALRPVLAVGRVLEAALLISGGRRRQLEALDNNGKGRPLTMGRPAYKGTEIQRVANRLLMTFEPRDFEAMESADRRRAIGQFAVDADLRVSRIFRLDGGVPSPPSPFEPISPLPLSPVRYAGRAQTAAGNRQHVVVGHSPSSFPSSSLAFPQQRAAAPPLQQQQQQEEEEQRPHTVAGAHSPSFRSQREGFPSMSAAVADLRGATMARDGDRSKRHMLNIPVWDTFRDGMLEETMRFKVRKLWREEIEYRGILDDRDRRLASALARSRKQNLRHTKKKTRMSREARIAHLCSPKGRMQEARKRHGIDWVDPRLQWGQVDPGVRRKLLGLSPPTPETPRPLLYRAPPEPEPEPEPVPIVPHDYFGRCADVGGRAWWENLLVKKKRPTREELALLPYDISKDVEDVEQPFGDLTAQFGALNSGSGGGRNTDGAGGCGGPAGLPLENGFLPFVGEGIVVQNTAAIAIDPLTPGAAVGNVVAALDLGGHNHDMKSQRRMRNGLPPREGALPPHDKQALEGGAVPRPQTAAEKFTPGRHQLIPVLRPSSAPAIDC